MYSRSFDRINKYSNSDAEPKAIIRNLLKSGSDFLPHPSAIFEGIETAALRSWLVIPNTSSRGDEEVIL